jgi:Flp pilus assembly protein TadB
LGDRDVTVKAEALSNTAQLQSCVNTVMNHARLFPIAVSVVVVMTVIMIMIVVIIIIIIIINPLLLLWKFEKMRVKKIQQLLFAYPLKIFYLKTV